MDKNNKKESVIPQNIKVQVLVNKILSGELQKIEPVYDSQIGYHYPILESIIGDSSQVPLILKRLVDEGILEKKLFDKTISCPNCDSPNLSFRYCCPFCKSYNIQKSSLIEHVKCGYMDIEPHFRQNDKLICPKCNQELKRIDIDYRKAGVWCSCKECNKSFDIPVPEHFCRNCHETSTFEDSALTNIYSYSLKANAKAGSSLSVFLSSAISEFLTAKGFAVESSALVKGKSGAHHSFDIVAFKDENRKIVLDIALSKDSVSEQPIIALFAKIFDVSPEKAYLIAVPSVNENAKKMAELYKIHAIEAKTPNEAVSSLRKEMG